MGERARRILIGAAGVATAIGAWQFAATVGPLSASRLPTALDSIARAMQLMTTAQMWTATAITIGMALGGLVIGAVLGVALGIGTGVSPLARHATRVPLEFLKPIPPIVILPIAVLVLGPTASMGVFLVIFGSVWAIAMQTSAGVYDTDPTMIATARSYGMRKGERLLRVVLPSATPYIGTAIRVAAPSALIIAVVAGLLGGGPGLGQSLLLAQVTGDQKTLFAYVLILGVLGLAVQGVSRWGERRFLHWHPQYREAVL